MKQLKTTLFILSAFILPAITSLLLDWSFIQAHWARQALVHLLMLVEFLCVIVMFWYYLKNKNENS